MSFVMWMKYAFCKVGTTFLCVMDVNLMLLRFNSVRTFVFFFSVYLIRYRCSVEEKRGSVYMATNNHKSAEHGSNCAIVLQMSEVSCAFVTLSSRCQKCLSHFRLSVIYNTNAFYFRTFIALF